MPGITASTTSSAGTDSSQRLQASMPSSASMTVNPSPSRTSRISERSTGSSSTISSVGKAVSESMASPSTGGRPESGRFTNIFRHRFQPADRRNEIVIQKFDERTRRVDAGIAGARLDLGAAQRELLRTECAGARFQAVRRAPQRLGVALRAIIADRGDDRRRRVDKPREGPDERRWLARPRQGAQPVDYRYVDHVIPI